jgi:hypothetical protein
MWLLLLGLRMVASCELCWPPRGILHPVGWYQTQMGMLFLTDPYVLTGTEKALSPSVLLQQ